MRRTCFLSAAVLALGLLLAGCGKSVQRKVIDQLASECAGLVAGGADLAQTYTDFHSADLRSSGWSCPTQHPLSPLPSNDMCAPATAAAPVCQFYFEYDGSSDPSLCDGLNCCYICEVRMEQAAFNAHQGDNSTPVCASRWYAHQPCQLLP